MTVRGAVFGTLNNTAMSLKTQARGPVASVSTHRRWGGAIQILFMPDIITEAFS